MYVQITTVCNMSCAHCCYGCGPRGKHMSQKTWEAVIKTVTDQEGPDGSISIGGGEPTLHPRFWSYLTDAIAAFDNVWLATNGSQTATALKLAKLARKGVIACALSQDEYHDPIDPSVVTAFWEGKKQRDYFSLREERDCREVRTVTNHPENMALFRDPEKGGSPENCPCQELIITPSGKVRFCGCKNAPVIGDVFGGFQKPEGTEEYDCWYQYMKAVNAENFDSFQKYVTAS